MVETEATLSLMGTSKTSTRMRSMLLELYLCKYDQIPSDLIILICLRKKVSHMMRRLRLNMYRAEDEMYIIRWTESASASAFAKEAAMEGGGRGVCQAAAEEGGGEEEEEEDEEQVVELFLKQPFDTLERKFP